MFPEVRKEFPEYIDHLATQLAECALKALQNISPRTSMFGISDIATSLTPYNFEHAKSIADSIITQDMKDQTYGKMARTISHNFDRAAELVETIENPTWKLYAYHKVSDTFAPLDCQIAIAPTQEEIDQKIH